MSANLKPLLSIPAQARQIPTLAVKMILAADTAFDWTNLAFLYLATKKLGFDEEVMKWI